MNDEEIKESMATASPEFLAAQVVVYRSLGMNKDFAISCMAELSRRKEEDGEEFDYETFIEEQLAEIPKPSGIDYVKISKDMQNGLKVKK